MRVKMDYNTWTKHVVEIVNRSKSEYCKDYGFSVVMGKERFEKAGCVVESEEASNESK